MELRDSRRLTGPNVLWERPGAVIEVALEPAETGAAVAAWRDAARRALDAVGWSAEEPRPRVFPGGASLAISAPLDALYAATEVNEWAFEAARAILAGEPEPELAAAAERLRAAIAAESDPALRALQSAARERGVGFFAGDGRVSVGMGRGSLCWRVGALPAPEAVDWGRVHDVPVLLVTGTNGKTTSVRLLAAMARAAGRTPGVSSTDWIRVGDEEVEEGDWSGPGGARRVLRHPAVDLALLETARGGMLRRGLALERADAALVTNVAADHLGEWGVLDVEMLADAKFVVARAARSLVLNADDDRVRERGLRFEGSVTWFSLDPSSSFVREHLGRGGEACLLDGEALLHCSGARREPVARVAEIPAALGGAARHNLANALGALGSALALGLSPADAARGLAEFGTGPEENPGRLNLFELGGLRALVDFAHNPHGYEALFETAAALPARRRLVLLGQAGDRDDESIRELVRIAWRARPDRILIKELGEHLRGRAEGEVPRLIESELRALGAPEERFAHAPSELEAVRRALTWAEPGDLLLFLTHGDRGAVLELLEQLRARAWGPGDPLPTPGGEP